MKAKPMYVRRGDKIIGRITKLELNSKDDMIAHFELTHCTQCCTKLKHAAGIGSYCPNKKCKILDGPFSCESKEA